MSTLKPAAKPAVKTRGRPPKRRKEQEAAQWIVKLNNDDFSPRPQSCESMAADAPSPLQVFLDDSEWAALRKGIEAAFSTAGPVLDKKREERLSKLVQAEIRKDPRTEEIKELKKQLTEVGSVTKEDKEFNNRVLAQVNDLKRNFDETTKKLELLIEPERNKIAKLEQQVKALSARCNSTDERIKSLEAIGMK